MQTPFSRRHTLGLMLAASAAAPAGAFAKSGKRLRLHVEAPFVRDRRIRLWCYRPDSAGPDSRIVMVMHGQGRNARTYLDSWIGLADTYGFLIAAPEFDEKNFPDSREYNQGWLYEADGTLRPRDEWSFSLIEKAFDTVVARFGSRRTTWAMFGHSAGAQFVHRFMLFDDSGRVERAIAANAGWYTLPLNAQPYPYGLGNAPVSEARLAAWLQKPLTLLLGDADTDPQQRSLNRSAEVMPQGPHRFARGHNMFETARREAARLNVPFGWTLQTVPGVAHSGAGMAPDAAKLIAHQPEPVA